MSGIILSLFSGLGALDEGFRREGWCVVSAGDVAWSSLYDVRGFHPPAGVFEGVIGGDPCQSHSALANLVRAKGLEPSFPDMTPEFVRVVEEARPAWFLRENVPGAPDAKPAGYDVANFLLDHSTMDAEAHPEGLGTGHEQMRRRRFWFGVRDGPVPELRKHLGFAFFVLPERDGTCYGERVNNSPEAKLRRPAILHAPVEATRERETRTRARAHAVDGSDGGGTLDKHEDRHRRQAALEPRAVPVKLGGSGKVKRTATATDGRHGHRAHPGNPPRYSLDEMLDLQGLPRDVFGPPGRSPLTMEGKRKLVGNAVALPMAEALARAVRCAMGARRCG